MNDLLQNVQKLGNYLVNLFHYIALFIIGATIVWSAAHDYIDIIRSGDINLEDILLLFIYLELSSMVGIYFKTHRLPSTVFDLYCYHRAITTFSDRYTKSKR